ncbi:uncharacterized protein LOC131320766 [Rhododendron vialii]|uniref:uncharacterized protein LOC131320766 n=1 Tax=Rhododendron vialii TaxID=182163 RepID=UPI00265D8EF6|nr:uncharacterized protein LOC131320766 [Rhododendron vialii]
MAEGCNVLASKVADQMLQMGDKNSRFFHLSTIQRRLGNQIVKLKDEFGIWRSEDKEIAGKKGHEVLVQGGVIDDLGRHLVEQYGIGPCFKMQNLKRIVTSKQLPTCYVTYLTFRQRIPYGLISESPLRSSIPSPAALVIGFT